MTPFLEIESLTMRSAPPGNEILAKILNYLTTQELREARLVSSKFNRIICSHPELLWGRNRLLFHTQSEGDDELIEMWREFNNLDLILHHDCPNYHFYKTDLASPDALDFFIGRVSLQIKHLKLTLCGFGSEVLFHTLSRVADNLEHLELVGLCNLKLKRSELMYPQPWTRLRFHSLKTVVLQSDSEETILEDPLSLCKCLKVSIRFLQCIFSGAPHLVSINFTRWSPETCHNFLQVLLSLSLKQVESIRSLDISCVLEKSDDLDVKQYYFLKTLEYIQLPSLTKLCISFDVDLQDVPGLSWDVVEDLTLKMTGFLESVADNLQDFKLINCPISSLIFGERLASFPCLFRLDTRGSFVVQLDRHGTEEVVSMLRGRNHLFRPPAQPRYVEYHPNDPIFSAQSSLSQLMVTVDQNTAMVSLCRNNIQILWGVLLAVLLCGVVSGMVLELFKTLFPQRAAFYKPY